MRLSHLPKRGNKCGRRSEVSGKLSPSQHPVSPPPPAPESKGEVSIEIICRKEQSFSEMCRTPCLHCLHRELAFACTWRGGGCVHVCARTQTHRQEKQSRLLILHGATSHLQRGRKRHCPNQGPASMEIISRRDTAARKHILCSQLLLFPQTAHPREVSVSESSTFAELLMGGCSSTRGGSRPRAPCPAAESPLGNFIPLSPVHCFGFGLVVWLVWFLFFFGGGSFARNSQTPEQKPKQSESRAVNLEWHAKSSASAELER